jgi:hypothetical protein
MMCYHQWVSSVAVPLTSVSVSVVGSSIGAVEGSVVVVGAVSIVVEDVGSTVGAGEAVVVGSPVVGAVVDSCSAIVGISVSEDNSINASVYEVSSGFRITWDRTNFHSKG